MKKFYTYLALIIICGLTLIPPIDWFINNPPNDKWLWMICIAGFLGFLTLFIDTNWYVRIIAIGGFINCFFSCIPYLSFTSYVVLIGCCYFYIVCERITDWDWIFKSLQAVLFLNVLLMIMASFGRDKLLNFTSGNHIEQYGVIGYHMLMGSFAVVISAFLISYNRFNIIFPFLISIICVSQWSFFCATVGLCLMIKKYSIFLFLSFFTIFLIWSFKGEKFHANLESGSGRGEVWKKTFELSNQRPWFGWGIGSYKDVFPTLNVTKEHYMQYRTAHNFILELIFEIGYPMTFMILTGLVFFIYSLWKAELHLNATGIIMVFLDALVHFPDRVTQCVPIIIALLAYSQFNLKRFGYERTAK